MTAFEDAVACSSKDSAVARILLARAKLYVSSDVTQSTRYQWQGHPPTACPSHTVSVTTSWLE